MNLEKIKEYLLKKLDDMKEKQEAIFNKYGTEHANCELFNIDRTIEIFKNEISFILNRMIDHELSGGESKDPKKFQNIKDLRNAIFRIKDKSNLSSSERAIINAIVKCDENLGFKLYRVSYRNLDKILW